MEDYCQQFAKEYDLDCNKWQYFSIPNKKLPVIIEDEEHFLKNTKGKQKKVIEIKLKEYEPISDKICIVSIDHDHV